MILGVTFHLMLRGSLCTERNPSGWKPPVSTAKIMMGAQNSGKLLCPTHRAWPKLSTWTLLTDHRTVTSCQFQDTQAISPSQDSNHQMALSFVVFSSNFPKLLPILILCNDLASDFTVNWSNLKKTPPSPIIISNHPPAFGPRSAALAPVSVIFPYP